MACVTNLSTSQKCLHDVDTLKTYARGIPKCELHIHIEGALEADLMLKLAKRNNVKIKYTTVEEVKNALKFTDLRSFLDLYYAGTSVLIEEEDFYELGKSYFKRAHKDNVKHAEVFFDPESHTTRGVKIEKCIHGLRRAQEFALKELGVTSKLIMCFLRDLPENVHLKTLEEAKPYIEYITAVGLDSNEVNYPCRSLQRVFKEAQNLGVLTVAHAGEEGPYENIIEALDILNAKRIDHGVRCVENADLLRRLIKDKIPLTVCPVSNDKLHLVTIDKHPLLKIECEGSLGNNNCSNGHHARCDGLPYYQSVSLGNQIPNLITDGLQVCINSDDPAYFGAYINDTFCACIDAKELNWNIDTIFTLAINSVNATFLSEEEKEKLRREINEFDKHFRANKKEK